MSLQELHTRALEEQVINLTQDCHYLISLLNQVDEIDWDSWPQGQKIKEHLDRSKDFFDAIEQREARFRDYDEVRKKEAFEHDRVRRESARRAAEYLKEKARQEKSQEKIRDANVRFNTLPWQNKESKTTNSIDFSDLEQTLNEIFRNFTV